MKSAFPCLLLIHLTGALTLFALSERIPAGSTAPTADALIVPQKAVFEIQDKNHVYVVDDNNRVTVKNFVPKARFSHFYLVESVLRPGERIQRIHCIRRPPEHEGRRVSLLVYAPNTMPDGCFSGRMFVYLVCTRTSFTNSLQCS